MSGSAGAVAPGADPEDLRHDELSALQSLLVLAMRMAESGDQQRIVHLAAGTVAALAHCRLQGVYLLDGGWQHSPDLPEAADTRAELEVQFAVLSRAGGVLAVPRESWGWAFPLRSLEGDFGYLAVGGDHEPTASQRFLLRVLAQQTGIALANARLHARERERARALDEANARLAETVAALEFRNDVHERLAVVAMSEAAQDGIAEALHELTGHPVAVEDQYGNLRAWAGPGHAVPYGKIASEDRRSLLGRAQRAGGPIRDGDRLLALADPPGDALGVLVLVDPEGVAGERARVALQLGALVLGMELVRQQSVIETELRLRRDLLEELLTGTDPASAIERAGALGHDLQLPHRVLVIEGHDQQPGAAQLLPAVQRATRSTGVGSLSTSRGGIVVLLAETDRPWGSLLADIVAEVGSGRCRMGVGGVCDHPADIPRSFREARIALRIQGHQPGPNHVAAFDDLGVYRLLAELDDPSGVERFARTWLGPLIDYDAHKSADLVSTLSVFLECGGSYEVAARALMVHRSTLKYRLQRIREISGRDLSDPDTRFNLQLASRAWHTFLVECSETAGHP